MSQPAPAPALSVVLPAFNEAEVIAAMYAELVDALERTGRTFEAVAVDDGSTDGTFAILEELQRRDARLRVIRLRRNFGQTAALSAGLDAAGGEWIITIDADLQNDPADIPRLLAKAEEGYDVVCGWRVHRRDPFWSRRVPSRLANGLIGLMTGVRLHDYGCSLKVFRAEVAKSVHLYGELHRFLPAAASGFGVQITELPVSHRPRERGMSKYTGWGKTFTRTVKVLLDLVSVRFLLGYATRPLHLFGGIGLFTSTIGVALAAYLAGRKLVLGESLSNRPLLTLAVLLIIVGVQFISMGLLGDLVVRTYHETQGKPIYSIRETLPRAPD